MPFRVYITEPPTLLDDLLEESARLFHNRCAVVHRVFHAEWLKRLREAVALVGAKRPGDSPTLVEGEARRRLGQVREALRQGRREMLREQERERLARDEAIRAYVATLGERQPCAA